MQNPSVFLYRKMYNSTNEEVSKVRFGIHTNLSRDIGGSAARALAISVLSRGSIPVFDRDIGVLDDIRGVEIGDLSTCDIIISIGGDGTFLSVISEYRNLDVPFVGINKGSIGFLTEISEDMIDEAVRRMIASEYSIINRMRLDIALFDRDGRIKGRDICVNDVAVLRGAKPHITKLTLYIDDERVEKFYGDGIVVASPTGSTAYTLAAGGPLLMPSMEVMLITPLCSHSLRNNSYVIDKDSVVRIELGDFETAPIICPDGRDFAQTAPGDVLEIRRYEHSVRTVNLGISGFFQNIRRKIVARGSFYENNQE